MVAQTSAEAAVSGPARGGRRPHAAPVLLVAAVLAAAFLAYSTAWRTAPIWTFDTPSYQRVAKDLKNFRISGLHQRTPGYPLLLALTGAEEKLNRGLFLATLALHLLGAAAAVWLLAFLGLGRAAVGAFLALALLPVYVEPSAYALTESLCEFFVVLAVAAFICWLARGRLRAALLAGFAAAFAALARPTYQAFLPLLAVLALICVLFDWAPGVTLRRFAAHFGLAAALWTSLVGGYAWLNYRATGIFDTSSMGAIVISHKVATVVEFLPDRYKGLREILVRHRDALMAKPFGDHTGQDYIYRAIPELRAYYGGDDRRMIEAVKEASLYLARTKPFTYLHESGKLLFSFWMPVDYPLSTRGSRALRALWAVVQGGVNALFLFQALVLAGAGAFAASARALRRLAGFEPLLCAAWVTGVATVLYTLFISCFVGVGDSRYRVPVDYVIFATGLIGIAIWRRGLRALSRLPRPDVWGNTAEGKL